MLEERQRNYRAEAQRLINANPTIQSELGTSNSLLLQLGMFPQAHAGGPLASPSVLPLSLGMPQQTLALAMSGGLREAAEDQRVPVPPKRLLPPGWQSAVDPEDGDTYYYNLNTGESTWEHPGAKKQCVDSAAPPPPPPETAQVTSAGGSRGRATAAGGGAIVFVAVAGGAVAVAAGAVAGCASGGACTSAGGAVGGTVAS